MVPSPSQTQPLASPEEWIGFRRELPTYVVDEGASYRPHLIVWYDPRHDLILYGDLANPTAEREALVAALAKAVQQPLAGNPRLPARIRVEDVADAEILRQWCAVHAPGIAVESAGPLPEIAAMWEHFSTQWTHHDEQIPKEPFSYLMDGHIDSAAMQAFFTAAAAVYRQQPWTLCTDDQLLLIDIAQWQIRESVVSIIGALGESFGFLIFDSIDAYGDFTDFAEIQTRKGQRAPHLPAIPILSINFDRGADLPRELREEIAHHRWPVAGGTAYPSLLILDDRSEARPPGRRDYEIATAYCRGIDRFFTRYVAAQRPRTTTPRNAPVSTRLKLATGPAAPVIRVSGLYVMDA